ncbi:MAG: hypothetical protein IPJ65_16250 [Archangiaceae bacterium]|nr:hypothetical protein [Archangiaceae bacterium]
MRARLPVALLCLLCACATTQGTASLPETANAPAPVDAGAPVVEEQKPTAEEVARQIEAMFARERDDAGTQTVTLDGKTLEVEAAAAPEVTRDDALRETGVAFSMGTAEKVQCFIYDQMVPVGTLLGRLTEGLSGKVEIKALRTSAIDVVEKEPLVLADIAYVAQTPKGSVLGQLKLAVYPNAVAPLACVHDEPGYVESFRRVVTRFASGLARARASGAAVSYRAVYVTSIRGAPVGFERSSWVKAKDGTRTLSTSSALIVPRSASEWMLQDSSSTVITARDGYVEKKSQRMTANGEEQLDVQLERKKGGYAYSGRVSQKDLSGTFKTRDKKGIASDAVVVREVKGQVMSGKKPELSFEEYLPDADPTAPLSVVVRRDPVAGADAVIIETGRIKMMARLDEKGDTVSVEVPMGPVTLVQERRFVEGSPE